MLCIVTGWVAWLAWIVVHIFYLIGFRNRLLVLIQYAWAYVTFQPGARIILPADDAEERKSSEGHSWARNRNGTGKRKADETSYE